LFYFFKIIVFLVKDLCHTGGTLDECRKALLKFGAKSVSAYVTHGVFDNDCHKRFIKGGDREGFTKFYVTNTIPEVSQKLKGLEPFHIIDVSSYLGADLLHSIEANTQKTPSQPITVYVSSTKESKMEATRVAFKNHFKYPIIDVVGVEVKSEVNEQPINEETNKGCANRLKNLKSEVAYAKLKTDDHTYYVSLESGMFATKDNKWNDITVAQVSSHVNITKSSEALSEPTECPDGSFMEQSKASNYKVTAGSLIEKQFGYAKDTWHLHVNKCRTAIMQHAVEEALKHL